MPRSQGADRRVISGLRSRPRCAQAVRRALQKDGFIILLSSARPCKLYPSYILGAAMKIALKLFFLPGGLAANLIVATAPDDRMMIRTLIDMLFWNIVIVVGALVIFL